MPTSMPDGNMVDKLAQFDLNSEMNEAESKKPWQSGHSAKTLYKKHDFRVVLLSMERGAHLKEHHADGTISVHVLKGRIRMNVGGKPHELPANSLFTLAASIRHDVEALEDSAFLLTISWPNPDELAAMKHRGYGS
ncbi:MAG TPA: cupin domain-containing protein [Acidobacteriaceae bacterium]|nr:cupin domain-containing protein [Acidobacteriaceae bacterium]